MHPQGSDVAHMYMIYIWSSSCLCVWKCVHAYTYICTHAYTYIECDVRPCTCPHTHTHTHTHTHFLSLSLSLSLSLEGSNDAADIIIRNILHISQNFSSRCARKTNRKKDQDVLKKKTVGTNLLLVSRPSLGDCAYLFSIVCFPSGDHYLITVVNFFLWRTQMCVFVFGVEVTELSTHIQHTLSIDFNARGIQFCVNEHIATSSEYQRFFLCSVNVCVCVCVQESRDLTLPGLFCPFPFGHFGMFLTWPMP